MSQIRIESDMGWATYGALLISSLRMEYEKVTGSR
jgi:hypothetical protein